MSSATVTEATIEAGMTQAIGALHSSYSSEQAAVNSIINNGYAGLVLPPEVKTVLNNSAQQGSMTNSFYGNLSGEAEQGAKGYVIELGEKALKSQKDLALTFTREVKVLVAQGFTIEQAVVKVTEAGNV